MRMDLYWACLSSFFYVLALQCWSENFPPQRLIGGRRSSRLALRYGRAMPGFDGEREEICAWAGVLFSSTTKQPRPALVFQRCFLRIIGIYFMCY
jgi:hypothetical protein